jgi:hypothetical protein
MSIDDFRGVGIVNAIKVWSEANKRSYGLTVSTFLTPKDLERSTISLMQFNVSLVEVSFYVLSNQPKFREASQERTRHFSQWICHQIESPYYQEKNHSNSCDFS